ncbi:hypothetical protein ACFQER_05510 [Halomicroarcula sp. GCM10025894]|uniref:hypothetical protein n=1 Tax=Halomicroarcula sp. GCM10025894 TaxID=3252673 RepID=UPI00361CFCD2
MTETVATVLGLAAILTWLLLELRWRSLPVGLRLPVYRARGDARDPDGAAREQVRVEDGGTADEAGSESRE